MHTYQEVPVIGRIVTAKIAVQEEVSITHVIPLDWVQFLVERQNCFGVLSCQKLPILG
jgi:hypothetical protein